jgi:small subunit ribosomal protein S8
MTNYSVADFIIRIKNAAMANRKDLEMPYSNINKNIGKVLVKEGYIEEVKEETIKKHKVLKVHLKYDKRSPVFTNVKVVSKPSLRVHKTTDSLLNVEKRGKHTIIMSTSQGVMTSIDARKKGIGGEILFEIW